MLVEIWDGTTEINGMAPGMVKKRYNIADDDIMYMVQEEGKIVYFGKSVPNDEQLRKLEKPVVEHKPKRKRIDTLREQRKLAREERKAAKALARLQREVK